MQSIVTYKEFQEKARELNLIVQDGAYRNTISLAVEHEHIDGMTTGLIAVNKTIVNDVTIFIACLERKDIKRMDKAINLACNFARTPIKDRDYQEYGRIYYFINNMLKTQSGEDLYLTYDKKADRMVACGKSNDENCQQRFTLEEIEKIKTKYGVSLYEWERYKVTVDDK